MELNFVLAGAGRCPAAAPTALGHHAGLAVCPPGSHKGVLGAAPCSRLPLTLQLLRPTRNQLLHGWCPPAAHPRLLRSTQPLETPVPSRATRQLPLPSKLYGASLLLLSPQPSPSAQLLGAALLLQELGFLVPAGPERPSASRRSGVGSTLLCPGPLPPPAVPGPVVALPAVVAAAEGQVLLLPALGLSTLLRGPSLRIAPLLLQIHCLHLW